MKKGIDIYNYERMFEATVRTMRSSKITEQKPVKVGESEMATFELFSGGKNIEEIAKERNLAVSTIYAHLYHLIANDYLSSTDVVSEEKIKQIGGRI